MKKKIVVGFVLIMLCFTLTGCKNKGNKVTITELKSIENKISEYFHSADADMENIAANYIDERNRVVVVVLIDNSEEKQEWFKKNVVDSKYIKFVQGQRSYAASNDEDVVGKTLIETYNVRNIEESNEEKYLWLTLRQYQDEEVASVRVSRDLASKVKVNDNYEFTFKINSNRIDLKSIVSIFNETELLKIEKTDKVGMEQTNGIID